MKIPTSSSIILATLAVSSSSTSLAAPTGDGGKSEIVSSQSNGQAQGLHQMEDSTNSASNLERTLGDLSLENRGNSAPSVTDIISTIPVLGPLISALSFKECSPSGGASSQSVDSVSPEDLARLQSAVDTVSDALSGVLPISVPVALPSGAMGGIPLKGPEPVKSAVVGVADADDDSESQTQPTATVTSDVIGPTENAIGDAGPDSSDADSSFLISPTTTVANAEEANETTAPSEPAPLSSEVPMAQADPTSPGVPSGPPNTPIPEATPQPDPDQDEDPDQEAK